MSNERGHLFVVQADMTRLAADAYLIPCDTEHYVNPVWEGLVPLGEEHPDGGWRLAPSEVDWRSDGLGVLADTSPVDPSADDVVGLRVFIDTVSTKSVRDLVDRAMRGIELAAALSHRHLRRHRRLIALPLLGVGQGTYSTERADVMDTLVTELAQFVSGHAIDVALVLFHDSDFAAAQWKRCAPHQNTDGPWSELRPDLQALAKDLGDKAAAGGLAVFAGSGVSQPLGMPGWRELLTTLAQGVGRRGPTDRTRDYPGFIDRLRIENLNEQVAERFRTRKHALSHALLIDLRTSSLVTTNYDPCLENAAAIIHRGELRVLANQHAEGNKPWLLKLHGSVDRPDMIVLGRRSYQRLKNQHGALRGVVQTLMLTKHLLFVGFGFAPDDYQAMSTAVDTVRQLASEPGRSVGTVLKLRAPKSDDPGHPALDIHVVAEAADDESATARRLEILLDMVAWRAQVMGTGRAAYFLDDKYSDGFDSADADLRSTLQALAGAAESNPTSAAHSDVMGLLRRLGYRKKDVTMGTVPTVPHTLLQRQLDIAWSFASAFVIDKVDPIALWEPAENVITVHQTAEGWRADWPDEENPPLPEATIGWLLWHIEWWWTNTVRAVDGLPGTAPDSFRSTGSTQGLLPIKTRWDEILATADLDREITGLMPTPQPLSYIAVWVNFELTKNLAEINQLATRHSNLSAPAPAPRS